MLKVDQIGIVPKFLGGLALGMVASNGRASSDRAGSALGLESLALFSNGGIVRFSVMWLFVFVLLFCFFENLMLSDGEEMVRFSRCFAPLALRPTFSADASPAPRP